MNYPKVISTLSVILMAIISLTCNEDEVTKRSYPVIDTKVVTEINENGATLNAEILDIGKGGISDHGFVYDDVPNPTLDQSDRISLGEALQKGEYSSLVNRNLAKDKRYYVRAYAVAKINSLIVYGQQVEFISLGGSAPIIDDFLPKEGTVGDTVLLIGTGFSNVVNNQRIAFGKVSSQIIKATIDSLWCIVPMSAPPGETEISLALGQFTVTHKDKFLLRPMTLTAFTPALVSYGDTVLINGTNFPSQKDLIEVSILDKEATIVSESPTELKVVVSNEVVVSESLITIKAGAQSVSSGEVIKLVMPAIINFTPAKGTGNTVVVITGNNFSPIKANNIVEINSTALTVVEASETTLKVRVPSGIPPGNYPISITVADQTVVSSSAFEIITPVITNISPLTGTWGDIITISGENFGNNIGDNVVKFDDVQATILSASSTELKVVVPSNLLKANSEVSVKAISVDNLSSTFNSLFVLEPPSIASFTPNEGKSKTLVTLSGSNFNPIPANQLVKFGDRQVQIVSASSTQLVVQLPTSLIDSDVYIQIDIAGQSAISTETFHLISPWRKVSDYPDNAKSDAVAFAIGNYGYVTLGTQTTLTFSKPCWKYDPGSNQWTPARSYYLASEGHGSSYVNQVSFVINDDAYVGLGDIGASGPREKMMRYSSADDDWYSVADFGGGRLERAVAYSIDGKGYITSGRDHNSQLFIQTWEYSYDLNSWARKADFYGPPRIEASAFSIGSKAYLTTGRNSSSGYFYNDLWVFDPSLNDWDQLASMPGSPRWQATAFAIDGLGYVIGGASRYDTYYSLLNDIWSYNPQSNSWTKLEDFPGQARAAAVAFVVGNKAYFGTGIGGATGYLKDFWEFDPSKL